jgi:hypothetical protein
MEMRRAESDRDVTGYAEVVERDHAERADHGRTLSSSARR